MRHLVMASIALLYAGAVLAQGAADFPAKPVTVVLGLASGAGTDLEVRMYAQKLAENTGKSFVMDYKPGAGTTLGAAYVAKAAPDGYTILAITPSFTTAPVAYKDLPYDSIKSFTPLSQMSKRSSLIIVKPSMPVSNGKEFLAYAKANPGKVNYGTSGSGGGVHLAGEWLASAAGVKFTFVHYKGGNQMYIDLMADRIEVVSSSPQSTLPMLKAGKVKAVGVTGAERIPMFPDLPTMAEQGAPGFDYTYWIAFIGPAGIPAPIVAKLNSEMAKVARDPAVIKKLAGEGNQAVGGTPDALRKHLANEISRWRKVVEDTGIVVEP